MTAPKDPGMETPVAPLGDGAAPKAPTRGKRSAAPKRGAARRASKRAARPERSGDRGPIGTGLAYVGAAWRPLLFMVLVQLLLALTVVVPFWHAAAEKLDHHAHAGAITGSPTEYESGFAHWAPDGEGWLDAGIWRDIKRGSSGLFDSLAVTAFWVAIVAWLVGALASGGFLGTAVSGENPVRVGAFLAHGARLYGPMLRVGLCFALAFYVVARIVVEAWGGAAQPTEFMASSEAEGFWGDRMREAVIVVLFFWLRIAADHARARIAVMGTRGAVGSFFRGLGRALCGKGVLTALALGVPAYGILLGLGLAAQLLIGDGTWTLVALFLVFQLAVLVRWAGRAAVLAGFAKLS